MAEFAARIAMQVATEQDCTRPFRRRHVHQGDVTTTFFKKDGRFWVRTEVTDGPLGDFEVRYTFGIFPLQQYLIGLPTGRCSRSG